MKKAIAAVLISLLVLGTGTVAVSAEEKANEDIVIGANVSTLNNAFFVAMMMGIRDKAEELGVTVVESNADNDVMAQAAQIDDALSSEVDALIINPIDSDAIVPSEEKAAEAGVPVIYCDRGSTGDQYTAFLASDNVEMGRIAADLIADFLTERYGEPKGKVVEIEGLTGSSAAIDRGQGFNERLEEAYPDIEVIARQPGDFNQETSMNVMQNIIQGNDEIDAVYGHNDDCTLGALQAIDSAGLLVPAGEDGHIFIVGIDGVMDAIKAIQDGSIDVTISQDPIGMGGAAVELAVAAAKGEELEKNQIQASYVIDKSNCDEDTHWGIAAQL